MTADSLEELRQEASPATLFVGDELVDNCWPRASRMLRLWDDLRGDAVAPHLSAFSPKNIGEDIALMAFFDVERDPFRLKCRLMGSAFSQAIGYDATGTYIDEQGHTTPTTKRAIWVVNSISPMLVKDLQLVWSPERSYKSYSSLILPFVGDGEEVARIVYLNQFRSI